MQRRLSLSKIFSQLYVCRSMDRLGLFDLIELLSFCRRKTRIRLLYYYGISTTSVLLDLATLVLVVPTIGALNQASSSVEVNDAIVQSLAGQGSWIILLGCAVSAGIVRIAATKEAITISKNVSIDLGRHIFKHFQDLELEDFRRLDLSNTQAVIVAQVDQVAAACAGWLSLSSSVINLILIAGLFMYKYPAGFILVLTVSIYFAFLTISSRREVVRLGVLRLNAFTEKVTIVKETYELFRELRLGKKKGIESYLRFTEVDSSLRIAEAKSTLIDVLPKTLADSLVLPGCITLIWLIIIMGKPSGGNVIGAILFFLFALQRLVPSANGIYTSVNSVQRMLVGVKSVTSFLSLDRVDDLGDENVTPVEKEASSTLTESVLRHRHNDANRDHSVLIGLELASYQGNGFRTPLFSNVSIQLRRGYIYSLIGESGRGKTTLVEIILGLTRLSTGKYICGDRYTDDLSEYRNSLAKLGASYVPQDASIVNGSMLDNIFHDYSAEDRLQQFKLREEKVMTLIESLGLSTIWKAAGIDSPSPTYLKQITSGGEKHRIALCRSLLSPALVIVLDEPSAALDSRNTKLLMSAVKENCLDKVVLIITHDKELSETTDYSLLLS